MIGTCNLCMYWATLTSYVYGSCHRYPPLTTVDNLAIRIWPMTKSTDYCGEFKPSQQESEELEKG